MNYGRTFITVNYSANLVKKYGGSILKSDGMRCEKRFRQHSNVSVYAHSVSVAIMCVKIAKRLHVKTDTESLVRGALLHDYFLYDWHIADKSHRWHGFNHAKCALENAKRDFLLNDVEENMILSHMFPLNLILPKYRESVILCVADKLCATGEIIAGLRGKRR